MPYGGGSIATSSGSQDISGTVATFPWSPQAGNSNLMLQNINDGAFFALEMSTSLGWNEDFPPEDYPQNIPQHNIPKLSGPGKPLSLSQVPPLPSSSGASSSIGLGLSPNGDFSCDGDFFANNFFPGPSTVTSNTEELFEELSQRVCDYPKKILQRDFGRRLSIIACIAVHREPCRVEFELHRHHDKYSAGEVDPRVPPMTRRLCTYKEAVTSDTETDWTRWKFAESLRRYASSTTEKTWRASNETQWQICREDTQLVRPAPTLQKLVEIDDAGQLDLATLTPLTRIILACARVNLEADWRDR
ncbi:hypothetical protein H112_01036 [Trichophyton rubrum D6]|uniref:Uncharacterized protein n=2 Tax=Trichophyton TaxID=5550 RepID=A0A022WER6_TRIRU|nr:hypothetical protein H100_01036 [Trichophyton rubrum MR850]EZF45919.1 hypothetical protein H102_01027 [Trichophyton rubrum CBS 100081]EZF56606.1 hypothetical protein H103_01035 [Trichophyton rubrum CBS 288.86]EZF67152.1 hypothetical protein H104_01020 [Trichophyton rubrum CBS 289.86]EZF77751.1 hypothetical protein H105_01036 [Trichophyton soudanense CBS 452.61]EZG20770.1 hypothetical protein H107_01085 [Trichophyton rubrum CBS 202.88]KDB37631.1 hypothetical protein H112_01036 [Trichophyton